MLRTPPHILVTTPESLYLLLTAERSREMLRTVRTVIVDEIHAVIGTRRGAHLALSLERLQQVAEQPLLRIGLSATQKPIDEVARFLVGTDPDRADRRRTMRDRRRRPSPARWTSASRCRGSPLDAVMSHEVWEEYYDRLTELIDAASHDAGVREHAADGGAHRAAPERAARRRRGDGASRQPVEGEAPRRRDAAERRTAQGARRHRVARARHRHRIASISSARSDRRTGSPRCCSASADRATRSPGMPKGRLFPVVARRPDRVRGAAARRPPRRARSHRRRTMRRSTSWRSRSSRKRRAATTREDELFALVTRAWPYRDLRAPSFDAVVAMAADGFATRRGRRSALVHRDEVNARLRGRRGARMLAITSGGAIPEVADYRVVLDPERHVHRHAQRGLRDREQRRRRLSARQRVVAGAAGRHRRRARRRRERRAADDSVLARRGAGAQRRAVARGQRSARGHRGPR